MKKPILVLILICLTLMGSSCSMLQKAGALLCNPTDSQKAEAKQGEAFAAAALALVQDTTLLAKLAAAESTFHNIQQSICVAVTELQDAINAVDAAGSTPSQVRAKATAIAAPDLSDLRKWAAGQEE